MERERAKFVSMKPVELFVHFDDADPAGIVFFGNFYRLAHRALELALPQWGLTWSDFFRAPGVGFPVRHSEADYMKPVRPGLSVFATVAVEKLGESSVTFRTEFRESSDPQGAVSAVVRVVHVCIDVKTLKKAEIPEELRAALA